MALLWEWARNIGGVFMLLCGLGGLLILAWIVIEKARLLFFHWIHRCFTFWGFWADFARYRCRSYEWERTGGGREWARKYDADIAADEKCGFVSFQ